MINFYIQLWIEYRGTILNYHLSAEQIKFLIFNGYMFSIRNFVINLIISGKTIRVN
jgi:hypothetical protein